MNQDPDRLLGGIEYPLYIRKLDRKSRWGHASDELVDRAANASAAIFPPSGSPFSLYLVRSRQDLQRVVVALNVRRGHPNEQVDLIAFRQDEIEAAGICITDEAPGETGCTAANELHVDLEAEENNAFAMLCKSAMAVGRNAVRVRKSEAEAMVAALREYGCEAFEVNDTCQCRDE